METAAADLPDDVDALKAMVLALTEKAALLETQAARTNAMRPSGSRTLIAGRKRQKRASRPPMSASPP
ncbi:MAG: hypothetical protein EOS13_29405 [Mesorhizobium sp.]|nr:MAG: hypothetical protein EOS13_29405 [Mesorhizobium sp.]